MWVAKIWLVDKNCIWATRCKKFEIHDFMYSLGLYKDKDRWVFKAFHIIEGEEKNKKKYIKEIKQDSRVKKLEIRKDFMISLVTKKIDDKELEAFKAFYNPKLIFLKPDINFPDGSEILEVGSFDREDIEKFINFIKKYYESKILFLKEIKAPKLFTPQLTPDLTEKQQNAFKIASEEGYYNFPRKTNLDKLARIMKVSRPTFEEHLRKAEIKLLNFMQELFLKK